jgi:integrase
MARKRRLPRSLPPAESRALVGAAPRQRDRLMIECGLLLGLRVSEIVHLEIPDVDFEGGQVLIREGKGDRDRAVPLPPKFAAELRAWLGNRTVGYVFPSPRGGKALSTRAVQKMLKRIAVRAGIPDAEKARRVHPHRLRHSFATHALRSGADIIEVRDLLGHTSVATTQVYLSSDVSRLRDVVARVEARQEREAA